MKKHVLIVDSEPRCYSQLRNKLIANNYDVFHAASIEEAMEHFHIRTADLLLVDLDVPGDRISNGLSRVAQLNASVRIIGVTERTEGSEIAVRERLDGVAEKPFALGNLITFVRELLRNPSPWKEFRYLAPRRPGLHVSASHRPRRVLDYPAAYSGWGINE
ncbi:MAG TPA: response regulator [Verrucomicrobiae bacterium]|nr:response regulator [Verrucomicrobiae bacterium]